jgi:hypothetical protein
MARIAPISASDPERIDAIIDSVVADPESAPRAKSMLRDTFSKRSAVLPFPAMEAAAQEDDDMWDNVPV